MQGGLKGLRGSVDGEAVGQCLSCHRLQLGLPRHSVGGEVVQGRQEKLIADLIVAEVDEAPTTTVDLDSGRLVGQCSKDHGQSCRRLDTRSGLFKLRLGKARLSSAISLRKCASMAVVWGAIRSQHKGGRILAM